MKKFILCIYLIASFPMLSPCTQESGDFKAVWNLTMTPIVYELQLVEASSRDETFRIIEEMRKMNEEEHEKLRTIVRLARKKMEADGETSFKEMSEKEIAELRHYALTTYSNMQHSAEIIVLEQEEHTAITNGKNTKTIHYIALTCLAVVACAVMAFFVKRRPS